MILKVLHLSDLHFKVNNVAQDLVIASLERTINEMCKIEKPNVLIITGDIAFSGKEDEYEQKIYK